MPFPVAAAVAAGASLLGTGGQIYASGKMNKKTRQWNEKMYQQQRQDALTDWEMQNQYNSPAAQMQRYREAGLNPNLIYGQSNEAGGIRGQNVQGWNPETPPIAEGVNSALSAYQDVQMRQAQTDLVKRQITIAEQEEKLRQAQIMAVTLGNKEKTYEIDQLVRTLDTNVDYRRAQLNKLDWETDRLIKQMNYDKGRYELDMAKGNQSIQNMKDQLRTSEVGRRLSLKQMSILDQQFQNMQKEGKLKDYQIKMEEILSNVGGGTPANFLFQLLMKLAGK